PTRESQSVHAAAFAATPPHPRSAFPPWPAATCPSSLRVHPAIASRHDRRPLPRCALATPVQLRSAQFHASPPTPSPVAASRETPRLSAPRSTTRSTALARAASTATPESHPATSRHLGFFQEQHSRPARDQKHPSPPQPSPCGGKARAR